MANEEARETAWQDYFGSDGFDGIPKPDFGAGFDAGVAEGIRQAREAVERERPEMGPHINVNQYRDGKSAGIGAALASIDALGEDDRG